MSNSLSRYCRGVVDFRWRHFGRKCVRTVIYPLIVINASMRELVRTWSGEEDDRESNRAKQYKLMEVLGQISHKNDLISYFSFFNVSGESIPQLVIR